MKSAEFCGSFAVKSDRNARQSVKAITSSRLFPALTPLDHSYCSNENKELVSVFPALALRDRTANRAETAFFCGSSAVKDPVAYVSLDAAGGTVSVVRNNRTTASPFRFTSHAQLEAWLLLNTAPNGESA